MLLYANLADPAPAGATRGRGPAAAGAAGMSTGHGPPLAVHGCGATPTTVPGLSVGHRPLRAAHDRGLAAVVAPGLSARHGPLRAMTSFVFAFLSMLNNRMYARKNQIPKELQLLHTF